VETNGRVEKEIKVRGGFLMQALMLASLIFGKNILPTVW
jgi:hypothetical protein